jgi:hypothetical protein
VVQEKADELPIGRHDLFADDDPLGGTQPKRARYGVVVGEKHRSEAQSAAHCGDLLGLDNAVK